MTLTADSTLAEAQRFLTSNVHGGVKCPCCGRFGKVYRRHITPGMVIVLVLLAQVSTATEDFVHVPSLIAGSSLSPGARAAVRGDFAKLRYWDLIEAPPEGYGGTAASKKKWTGHWRITRTGRAFAKGELRVQKYRYLYNKEELPAEVLETTTAEEALGKKFDYDELMRSSAGGSP